MHLAQAYRSLPRPSSASRTEPFTDRRRRNPTSGTSLICSTLEQSSRKSTHIRPSTKLRFNGQTLLTPRSNDKKLSYTWQRVLRRALLTPTNPPDSQKRFRFAADLICEGFRCWVRAKDIKIDAPSYVNSLKTSLSSTARLTFVTK